MKLYRIKNWSQNYENNRTREMKTMSWVPLPINLHGSGYVALMSKKNGPAIFGTWCALLELAATCEIRGTFSRGRGIPHTISTISSQLRIPEKLVAATLELLESEEIDWVESIESDACKENPAPLPQANCGETAVKLRDDCGETAVSGRKEQKEQKKVVSMKPQTNEELWNQPPEPAQVFMDAYPRQTGIQLGIQTYCSVVESREHAEVLAGLERWKQSEAWAKDGGKYIPEAHKWLTDRRWKDHPQPRARPAAEDRIVFVQDIPMIRDMR